MVGRKKFISMVIAVMVAVVWLGVAAAQETPVISAGPQPGRGGRQGLTNDRQNPEQMQQRFLDRIKEELRATDQEWQVLKPRVEKVMSLSRQGVGMRMMMGRRGGENAPEQMSSVTKAATELQAVLKKDNAGATEISAGLAALREARQRSGKDIANAQAALKELLTARQEAQLVLMGLLD